MLLLGSMFYMEGKPFFEYMAGISLSLISFLLVVVIKYHPTLTVFAPFITAVFAIIIITEMHVKFDF